MNRIRFLRLKKALKQEELAKVIHVSQSSLSGYENEKYEPDKKTLLKLASYFNVSVDYLLGREPADQEICRTSLKIPVYQHLKAEKSTVPKGIVDFQDTEPCEIMEGSFFGLQMHGDCMEPRILDGDIVIVRSHSEIKSGDIAVIQVGSQDAIIRKIIKYEGGITLIGYNPKDHPVTFTNEEIGALPVLILGKVVEIRGKC